MSIEVGSKKGRLIYCDDEPPVIDKDYARQIIQIIFVEEIPKTSVGKFDKVTLRRKYA